MHTLFLVYFVNLCIFRAYLCPSSGGTTVCTRRARKGKIHHVYADRENFYAYCGNTAVDLDPIPVSRARLTVVEPALFE